MTALSLNAGVRLLIAQGAVIPCFRCHQPIVYGDKVQREHPHPKALGGPDTEANAAISHNACHLAQTIGRKVGAEKTATTAGSDIHAIHKVDRLLEAHK